jgi:rhamnose utilization protein RhaD (predicted bifunctional aldolase and dehydrogenase)/NAD(P)-dependent dehydrogenase (short-subunit alcohol dehydrogenase family)
MQNRWNPTDADRALAEVDPEIGRDVATCIYLSRLVGRQPDLVLHGGGNTSVKTAIRNIFGETRKTLFVKASGHDLSGITTDGFAGLDQERMEKFRGVTSLSQEEMLRQMRLSLINPDSAAPSVEGFLHAFIPAKFVLHTHPSAILALTNQDDAANVVQQILGSNVTTVRYLRAGYGLAQETAQAYESKNTADGIVLLQHGLVTWGETAEQAYGETIRLVSLAEEYWKSITPAVIEQSIGAEEAWKRYEMIAPLVRGLLSERTANEDHPFRRLILAPFIRSDVIDFLNHPNVEKLAVSAPLTPDHLIRTKPFPLLIKHPDFADENKMKQQISSAIEKYAQDYEAYVKRHRERLEREVHPVDPLPRVLLLPGIGAVCAGINEKAAIIARDITEQSLTVKRSFLLSGKEYRGIEEEHLFEMEYLLMQQAKVQQMEQPLQRQVAIVTGAAGAIGMGITEGLLKEGCHVAITDLGGESLDRIAEEFRKKYPYQVLSTAMDVTDPVSVQGAFYKVIRRWGGVDLIIVNAGVAMVSSISEMDLDRFRQLEKVNVEGTLIVLREAANLFQRQGTGGDVVLISTKNVFAPGAKFGAYSATKAAAHQLARIASLEFAELGVRVNMVAPDAVFSHGKTKSGLWAEVGPDRMKARGLNESELEEYYRNRNLLKATVTAEHVARAVLFFATRQTPTTGATLPVDGGLPDSTPR